MKSALNWFEIPVTDFDRALDFYQTILDTTLDVVDMNNTRMGMIPIEDNKSGVGGGIVYGPEVGYKPSQEGTLVYLSGGDDLNTVLNKVESAGGSVLMPKTNIGDNNGYMALFTDTEGNKVGLHSMQ